MGWRARQASTTWAGGFPTELTGHLADAGFAESIREHTLLARTPVLEEIDGPLLFLATVLATGPVGRHLVRV